MAITYTSSQIQINSGKDSGTATSGTTTSLVCSSKAWTTNAFKESVVWITGGTGAGQSRQIASNTATTLVPQIAFTTAPASNSTFVILYRLADVVAAVPTYAAWNAATDSKVCELAAPIRLMSGGALSSNRETLLFTTGLHTLLTDAGSYFQAGRPASLVFSEVGIEGGIITGKLTGNAYWHIGWKGKMRLYGTRLEFTRVTADTINAYAWINYAGSNVSSGIELYGVDASGVVISGQTPDTFVGCVLHGHTCSTGDDATFTLYGAPSRFQGNVGGLSPRDDVVGRAINGGDVIDHSNVSSASYDLFLYEFRLSKGGVCYLWNTKITNAWASIARWYDNEPEVLPGDGHIYRGYLVGLSVTDSAGAAVQNALVGVLDVNGAGGILTSKAANKTAVRTASVLTNASGTYTGIVGSGEGLPILYARYTKASEYTSTELLYAPFVFKVRKYGKQFLSKAANYTERSKEQITLSDNVFTAVLEAVASSYTGITANNTSKTIVLSATHSVQHLYDYMQWWSAADVTRDEALLTFDGANTTLASGWKLTADGFVTWDKSVAGGTVKFSAAGTYSPILGETVVEFAGAGTYSMSGATLTGAIELVNTSGGAVTVSLPAGTTYTNTGPNITVTAAGCVINVTNLVTGSRVAIKEDATGNLIYTALESAGEVTYETTYGDMIRIDVRKASATPFYRPWTTQVMPVAASTVTVIASQELD